MSMFDDYISNLGSFYGTGSMTKPNKDNSNAQDSVSQGQNAFAGMTAPSLQRVSAQGAATGTAGPSAMGGVQADSGAMQAQRAQMAALGNLAANGGRNAASDANLAQIQEQENANAAGQRGAIMQNAAARGMGGSGASLLAQLSAQQADQTNQNAQDMAVRGQEAGTALQAGQAAAGIGSSLEGQQFNEAASRAQAQDAINRFNAGQNQQASEFNANAGNQAQEFNSGLGQAEFGDRMGIASGQQRGGQLGQEYWGNKYKEDQQANGGLLGGLMKMGSGAVAAAAARGGKVPGQAPVAGDSTLNDVVPVNTSPGEVVVPRTLAKSGDGHAIASFVKNPPKIQTPDHSKVAMLSALKRLGRK